MFGIFCVFRVFVSAFLGNAKWGLSRWGLKVLVHNCPRLPTIVVILRRKFPLERGPKRPQKCTIVDDCAQIAESGLKPPFESPAFGLSQHSPHFPRFRVFCSVESPQPLVFLGSEGPSAFSTFSPYRLRIADFGNPTDRLYSDRP